MSAQQCYKWSASRGTQSIRIEIINVDAFVALLSEHLGQGFSSFRTDEQVAATVVAGTGNLIGDGLLGSISEYAVYVIRRTRENLRHPFVHCFRAPDPLGAGTFPLVDILAFRPKANPSDDFLQVQEIKATRRHPAYFTTSGADFDGLYAKSRLAETAERLKWDLQHANKARFVTRVNDCLGTCPADSNKIELLPTGVSGDLADEATCLASIEKVIDALTAASWPRVRGMYVRIPSIEQTFKSFACGQGVTR